MADKNLKIVITAVDKASKTMGKVGSATEKMGKIGVGAAAGLAAFGVTSVKAFSDAQSAQIKLQDTFEKFPRLADVSLGSLREYNGELQKKTRFDDDAIASGQAILGQYKITGQQLKDLTPLVADYAAKTGKSFEDASKDIGKALTGSGRALKAVGINFKDAGSQGANLDQIMVGLRGQVGGFAEKEALTGAGAAERLKNQFGELQETTGEQLLPALSKLAGVATEGLQAFNSLPGPVKQVTGAIVLLGTAALVAAPKVLALKQLLASTGGTGAGGEAGKFTRGLGKATALLGGPWGLAIAGGVTALGIFAAKKSEATARVRDLTAAIEADTGVLGENTRALVVNQLEQSGALRKAQALGLSLDDVADAALGNAAAQKRVNDQLAAYLPKGVSAATAAAQGGRGMSDQARSAALLSVELGNLANDTDSAAAAAKRKASAMRSDTDATNANARATRRLASNLIALNGVPGRVPTSTGPRIAQRASGGPVRKGTPYIVGEKRAELFVPGESGTILPRVPSPNAGRAMAGGQTIIKVYTLATDEAKLARELARIQREQGGRGARFA